MWRPTRLKAIKNQKHEDQESWEAERAASPQVARKAQPKVKSADHAKDTSQVGLTV